MSGNDDAGALVPLRLGRVLLAHQSSGPATPADGEVEEMASTDVRQRQVQPNPERLFSTPTRVALVLTVGIITWYEGERVLELLKEMLTSEEA